MLSDKLETIRKKYPQWSKLLDRIGQYLTTVPPGHSVDPQVVASRTGLSLGEVLALLQVLSEATAGKLQIRVVDPRGIEVATFTRRADLPSTVEDEFGQEITVEPENVELVFKLAER